MILSSMYELRIDNIENILIYLLVCLSCSHALRCLRSVAGCCSSTRLEYQIVEYAYDIICIDILLASVNSHRQLKFQLPVSHSSTALTAPVSS